MLRIVAPSLIALVTVLSSPAAAQQAACDSRTEVVRKLNQQFSETSAAIGLANNGGVVELMTSEDEGSWSIIITLPDGQSCLIATGHSWEALRAANKAGLLL